MAKEKADKVHVHRIEFQQKERELLETAMTAYSVNRVSTPIIALLSDVSAMSLLVAGYVSYKYGEAGLEFLKDKYEDTVELYNDAYTITKSVTPIIADSANILGVSVLDIFNLIVPDSFEIGKYDGLV